MIVVLLTFGIGKITVAKTLFKKTSKSYAGQYASYQGRTSIESSHQSSNTTDELVCEERCDDETKEDYIDKSCYAFDLLLVKPTVTISSKEFVYYNSYSIYKAPQALYNLFCSWKSFLV